jgi:hypothetical protein
MTGYKRGSKSSLRQLFELRPDIVPCPLPASGAKPGGSDLKPSFSADADIVGAAVDSEPWSNAGATASSRLHGSPRPDRSLRNAVPRFRSLIGRIGAQRDEDFVAVSKHGKLERPAPSGGHQLETALCQDRAKLAAANCTRCISRERRVNLTRPQLTFSGG